MESPTQQHRRDEPHQLGDVLSQLFALRGYGRTESKRQLTDIWRTIAGESISASTRVRGIKAGVLQVSVSNSALLQELTGFHQWSLLEQLQTHHADLKITGIKFRLNATANQSSVG